MWKLLHSSRTDHNRSDVLRLSWPDLPFVSKNKGQKNAQFRSAFLRLAFTLLGQSSTRRWEGWRMRKRPRKSCNVKSQIRSNLKVWSPDGPVNSPLIRAMNFNCRPWRWKCPKRLDLMAKWEAGKHQAAFYFGFTDDVVCSTVFQEKRPKQGSTALLQAKPERSPSPGVPLFWLFNKTVHTSALNKVIIQERMSFWKVLQIRINIKFLVWQHFWQLWKREKFTPAHACLLLHWQNSSEMRRRRGMKMTTTTKCVP